MALSAGHEETGRRGKRWRLAVIVAVAAAMVAVLVYRTHQHDQEVKAAEADVAVVAQRLQAQVAKLDLRAVAAATTDEWINGRPQSDFPGRPTIAGATLAAVTSTPDHLELTFRVSSHGQHVCVTASRTSSSDGVRLTTGPCPF